jgi:hypothetical protein
LIRHAFVIAASLVTFIIPNAIGLAVWYVTGGLDPIIRSLTAILGWVVGFGLGTQVFWRIIQRAFPGDAR